MREFFKGWRRKAGVVALGLACVFMALWSLEQLDREPEVTFSVSGDGIRLEHWWPREIWGLNPSQNGQSLEWQGFEFDQISTPFGNTSRALWKIPCWFVALSLSLLSAYLLLVKPRPRKPQVTQTQPAPTTGE